VGMYLLDGVTMMSMRTFGNASTSQSRTRILVLNGVTWLGSLVEEVEEGAVEEMGCDRYLV